MSRCINCSCQNCAYKPESESVLSEAARTCMNCDQPLDAYKTCVNPEAIVNGQKTLKAVGQ